MLQVMKRNLGDAGSCWLDDVLLMRMDSGSCPLKGKSRGKSSGWGGASRRFKVRVVERAI